MKRLLLQLFAVAVASPLIAAPLFEGATESKWSVTKGGASVATITLLTSTGASRAEWRSGGKAAPVVFISADRKVWVRQAGGDVELSEYKGGVEASIVPALLLDAKSAKAQTHTFGTSKATYRHDGSGASAVDVTAAGVAYALKRTAVGASTADASNFTVRPRKAAASRLARLSGDLLGPSQSSVSATAGGRGAGKKGLRFKGKGDYAAVESIEDRDAAWSGNLDAALSEFQQDGKVGKGRAQ